MTTQVGRSLACAVGNDTECNGYAPASDYTNLCACRCHPAYIEGTTPLDEMPPLTMARARGIHRHEWVDPQAKDTFCRVCGEVCQL